MPSAFELEGIRKDFGATKVLQGVSLRISQHSIVLLLGANGAGKSTLLRIGAGLLRPDSGKRAAIQAPQTSYLGHQTNLYSDLSVRENFKLFSELLGLSISISQLIARWELTKEANRRVGSLSRGTQYRCALARALLNSPKYLLLDEPSSSLDDHAFSILVRELSELKNCGVLIATHDLARFLPICTRVVLLENGKIANDSELSGDPHSIAQLYSGRNR